MTSWPILVSFLLSAFAPSLVMGNGKPAEFIRGADISSLPRTEKFGGVFFDGGAGKDPLEILKGHGMNWVRLRLFREPDGLWGAREGLDSMVKMAHRAKRSGFKVLLDIHYSDTWADPGSQKKPRAWKDLGFPDLCAAVGDYTASVIAAFRSGGALPDMVQIGNEVTQGMLWPDGKVWGEGAGGWDNFAALIKAGQEGVRKGAGPGGKVVFLHHIDNAGKAGWHLDELLKRGVKFDLLGVSYYPWWHGDLGTLERNLSVVTAKYAVDVLIAETAYPWTDKGFDGWGNIFGGDPGMLPDPFPMTPEGQEEFTRALLGAVRRVPGDRGKGVIWWEPTWISIGNPAGYRAGETENHDGKGGRLPAYGSCVENVCLFDSAGATLPALRAFRP